MLLRKGVSELLRICCNFYNMIKREQYKEWSKEKLKMRTTRSKSRTARCTEQERKRDTLRRVLTN
ncbi:hypothetical protein T10_3141 [Trichinella papuae]|uniref:Uncharacterized protein n=1 Tax=Trichinella papuae TaxID=268474 RepID=A0A0V1MX67_9BILA|nr:hypothetical protein T10_3141 [Trichinella papuae]